ncbi:MAG TPA: hypothetical protein VJV23_02655 [Candidatus Polarisedimenticolia bacterium]|nr:hypothetical protein [Candidatus Polarisedimenticolia bacterium]
MRTGDRILCAALLAAALALPASLVVGGESGRDFSRCNNGCVVLRQNCDRQCQIDCKAMFPNNAGGRQSCQTACKDACVAEEKECKLICKAEKNEETPDEP